MPTKKAAQYQLGGVDSRSNPANYPPERLLRCRNWSPLPSGQLQLRFGYSYPAGSSAVGEGEIHSAAYYEQYAGAQYVLFSSGPPNGRGQVLRQVKIDGTGLTNIGGPILSGNPWGHYRSANRIFIGDGTQMVSWDAVTLRPVGIRAPSATEIAGISATTSSNSSASFATTSVSGYDFWMVYFNPVTGHVGNRVQITQRVPISAVATQVVLSGLPDLSAVNGEWVKGLGMTNDNGQVPYWLVDANGNRIVVGNTATVATLTSSVVDFTQELPYRNGVPVPMDKFTKVGTVIFGAADGDINLHYTENDNAPTQSATSANFVGIPAESWPPDNIEPFPTGEVPTCIQTYGGTQGFFYSKNYFAIWSLELYQAGQNPWASVINVGCAGQRAWVDTPYGPIWLTLDKQLMTWNGSGAVPISEEYEASLLGKLADATLAQTELGYVRDADLLIDRLYVRGFDKNGNQVIIVHDFRLQDYRNQVAMGYEFSYSGQIPTTIVGAGYTPRQNVRDANGRERLWMGTQTGQFMQIDDGSTLDGTQNYTGDAIALINAGDGKPLLDAIEWQGDGNVEVSFSTKTSLNLADFEVAETEEVEFDNPDNRYQAKVNEEAKWVYARFQLTSHPADGNFAISDPPFIPMPTYGIINGITPRFGRGRPEAP